MSDGMLAGLIVLGNLVFFPVMWVGASYLISHISGWNQIAQHYAISSELMPQPRMHWRSLSMGYTPFFAASYSSVVNIGVDSTNLYLSCLWLLRVGHRPLCIPFEDIEITESNILFFTVKRLVTKSAPNIKIYMRPKLVQKIEGLAISTA